MVIVSSISAEDLAALRKKVVPETRTDTLLNDAEAWLSEMGVTSANLSLIKLSNGRICAGSDRVPILVEATSGPRSEQFVIKRYEHPDEKCVLAVVQGKLAPAVLYSGRGFYAEEFVDVIKTPPLHTLEKSLGLEGVLAIGAEIHADLAKLKINYAHNHWLDEFHVGGDRRIVTDFGAAHLFYAPGQNNSFDDGLAWLKEDLRAGRDPDTDIPCLSDIDNRTAHAKAMPTIMRLSSDHVELVNLFSVLRHAAIGIKGYIEQTRSGNAWQQTITALPAFVDRFSARYHTK